MAVVKASIEAFLHIYSCVPWLTWCFSLTRLQIRTCDVCEAEHDHTALHPECSKQLGKAWLC